MNMNFAASEPITHRTPSALFSETQRIERMQKRAEQIVLPTLPVSDPLRSKVAKQPRKRPNVDRQNPDGNAALHFAAFDGELGQTRLLLATGADVNISNRRGDTPLICGAYSGQCNVIMALIAAGADLEAKDEDGRTALMWAVIRGQTDAVRLLISLGADISVSDNVDNTPLLWAVIHNRREICDILIEAEDRLNIR